MPIDEAPSTKLNGKKVRQRARRRKPQSKTSEQQFLRGVEVRKAG